MAKWKSAIFTDIRNKLGESVVFSMWKGRPYMRSYVKPSNPKTVAQTANRLHMALLVQHWQSIISVIPPYVTAWNKAALSDLISGYNRFVKGARGYVISSVNLAHGTFTLTVDSSSLPLNEMILCVGGGVSSATLATKQTLGVYTAADFSGWSPAATDKIFLVDKKVYDELHLPPAGVPNGFAGAQLVFVDEVTGSLQPVTLT